MTHFMILHIILLKAGPRNHYQVIANHFLEVIKILNIFIITILADF